MFITTSNLLGALIIKPFAEANLHPDWVAGISIGAVNAALIAGNPSETRVEKLREFWDPELL